VIRLSLLLIFGLLSPLSATVLHQIDMTAPLRCTFALQHHNRILVEGGRIRKVICPEVPILVRLEEESGQAFVSSMSGAPLVVTLSIVTSSGSVQDIEIHFENRTTETVVLKERSEEKPKELGYKSHQRDFELVNVILSGHLPKGYRYLKPPTTCQRLGSGARSTLMAKLEGPDDYIFVYWIENRERHSIRVHESELPHLGSRWVYLESNQIPTCSRIVGLVSMGKP
jgi:TraK protein